MPVTAALIMGGASLLGGSMQSRSAKQAAETSARAQLESARIAAEAARQVVREKYATMQTAIDSASTVDEIKAAMP